MINLVKVISSTISNGLRRVKFLRLGKNDIQESTQVAPFGVDSVPVENLRAVYATTGEKGKTVLLGYVNIDHVADPGEYRIFSTDVNGNLAIQFHLRNDGTAELGGTTDNLVRFNPLNSEMNNLQSFINTELAKIQTGIVGAGGAYTPGTANIDISGSKVDNLKSS